MVIMLYENINFYELKEKKYRRELKYRVVLVSAV